jgi:hypothetical protein
LSTPDHEPSLGVQQRSRAYAFDGDPAHRTVRVDADLLAEVEDLARRRLVPVTFSEQVEAGLRHVVRQARENQTRHAAGLVGADRPHAGQTYRRLHGRGGT